MTTSTLKDAAEKAGIPERTFFRWMREPELQEALREARQKAWEHAVSRLQQAVGAAVEALEEIAAGKDSPATARVAAAKAILERAQSMRESDDLSDRIAELEKTLAEFGVAPAKEAAVS